MSTASLIFLLILAALPLSTAAGKKDPPLKLDQTPKRGGKSNAQQDADDLAADLKQERSQRLEAVEVERRRAEELTTSLGTGACGSGGLTAMETALVPERQPGEHISIITNISDATDASEKPKKRQHMTNKELADACGLRGPLPRTDLLDLFKWKQKADSDAASKPKAQQPTHRLPSRGQESTLWVIFATNGSTYEFEGGKWRKLLCQINNCKKPEVHERLQSNSERRKHLRHEHKLRDHEFFSLMREQVRILVETGKKDEAMKEKSGSTGSAQLQQGPPGQRRLVLELPSGSNASKALLKPWVRNIMVPGLLPYPSHTTSAADRQYRQDVATQTQARFALPNLARASATRVVDGNVTEMHRRLRSELERLPWMEGTTHTDNWEDPFHNVITGTVLGFNTWEDLQPLHVLLGAEKTARHANQSRGVGPHTAAASATAVKSTWETALAKGKSAHNPGASLRPLPPFGMSNNTNSAVKTINNLGLVEGRCAPHFLQIMIRRTCFPAEEAAEEDDAADDVVFDEDAARLGIEPAVRAVILQAMERVRAMARAFLKKVTLADWCRTGLSRCAGVLLDSNADWFTTEDAVRRTMKLRLQLAAYASQQPDFPSLPSPLHWQLFPVLLECLEIVGSGMRILQKTNALVAQVWAIFTEVQNTLLDLHTRDELTHMQRAVVKIFLGEWEGIHQRHLQRPLRFDEADPSDLMRVLRQAGINTYLDILQVASLWAIGAPSDDEGVVPLGHPRTIREKAEAFIIAVNQLNPPTQPSGAVERAPGSPQRGRERNQHISGMMGRLRSRGGRPLSAADGGMMDLEAGARSGFRQFLTSQTAPGAHSASAILHFWRLNGQRLFHLFWPATRIVLSWSAGNGMLERCFGKRKQTLTPHRHGNNLNQVLLAINAPQLHLPGYVGGQGYFEQDTAQHDECDLGGRPRASTPWASTPWASTPRASSPWASTPWASIPRASTPWASTPWASTPWASTPWASTPQASTPWASTP